MYVHSYKRSLLKAGCSSTAVLRQCLALHAHFSFCTIEAIFTILVWKWCHWRRATGHILQFRNVSSRPRHNSSSDLVKWDLWWTKWRWGRFSPSTSVSPAKLHATKFSIIIIIRGRYNRPFSGRRAEWTQFGLHPPLCELKKKVSSKYAVNVRCCEVGTIFVALNWSHVAVSYHCACVFELGHTSASSVLCYARLGYWSFRLFRIQMHFGVSFNIVMYRGFAWLIIMGSGFDDWIYWHLFTITVNYACSQSVTVYDSLHSLLDYECLLFHCDEWRTKNLCSHLELLLNAESRICYE
jgi:hypothetical protein